MGSLAVITGAGLMAYGGVAIWVGLGREHTRDRDYQLPMWAVVVGSMLLAGGLHG